MKIAFVTFGNFQGHATLKRATGMAGPLVQMGHEVHLLLEDSPDNREKVELECPQVKVHWHDRARSAWRERKFKQQVIERIRPDVVWICGVGLRNWICSTNSESVILADHSELYSVVSDDIPRKIFYWFLEWIYCFAFDGHICASRYLENFYRKRLKFLRRSNNVYYSPYGFHAGIIRPDSIGASTIRQKYDEKKILLYVGTFWRNYGFWDLLKAFERLNLQRNDFVAIMAGSGPEEDAGRHWIADNGLESVIKIVGYLPEEDLSAYFTATQAFICPLRRTIQDIARCPSKLFLYLPFRRPIVTCSIGEAAELFGERGYYYEHESLDSLEKVLGRALDVSEDVDCVDSDKHSYETRSSSFMEWLEATYAFEK